VLANPHLEGRTEQASPHGPLGTGLSCPLDPEVWNYGTTEDGNPQGEPGPRPRRLVEQLWGCVTVLQTESVC